MTFETVRDAIKTVAESGASGNYKVVGGQRQSKGASEDLTLPRMTVFYNSGNFLKSSSNFQGDKLHEAYYKLEITIVKQAEADLSVLNNPSSTPAEIAAALAAMPDLSAAADELWDSTFAAIYQVIMNADNYDLGLDIGVAVDRWIDQVQKDNPLPRGQFLVLTGSAMLTVRMKEDVSGLTGLPGTVYDNNLQIKDDPNENAGTSGTLGG